MEKVSVIIPTYNRGEKILASVESVLQQTYRELELLIVDDGSSDNTQEVVEAINDARIRYIRLDKNMGASAARNEGAKHALGDVISYNDSDDLWRPRKLELQMKYKEEHPEYSMVYCAYEMHTPDGNVTVPNSGWNGEMEGDIFPWLLVRNTIGTPTMLMDRDCFLEVGGFDTSLKSLEDWEFAIRFAQKYKIGFIEEPLVDAYYSPGGVSSVVGGYYETRCKMIAKYREQMVEYGIFDKIVYDLFSRAEERNILEPVKKMLMLYMSN